MDLSYSAFIRQREMRIFLCEMVFHTSLRKVLLEFGSGETRNGLFFLKKKQPTSIQALYNTNVELSIFCPLVLLTPALWSAVFEAP